MKLLVFTINLYFMMSIIFMNNSYALDEYKYFENNGYKLSDIEFNEKEYEIISKIICNLSHDLSKDRAYIMSLPLTERVVWVAFRDRLVYFTARDKRYYFLNSKLSGTAANTKERIELGKIVTDYSKNKNYSPFVMKYVIDFFGEKINKLNQKQISELSIILKSTKSKIIKDSISTRLFLIAYFDKDFDESILPFFDLKKLKKIKNSRLEAGLLGPVLLDNLLFQKGKPSGKKASNM